MKLIPLAIALLNGTAHSQIVGIRAKAQLYSIFVGGAAISALFLTAALTIAIAGEIGALYACLVMAGVFALIALAGLLRINAGRRAKERLKAQEKLLAASAASTPVGAGIAVSAAAFLRGFLNPKV